MIFFNKFVLGILLLGIVSGCAARTPPPPLMSPYGPGAPYGYVDEQIADSAYRVTYVGPEISTASQRSSREKDSALAKTQAGELARWRAAQLAIAAGVAKFAVDREEIEVEVTERRGYYPHYHPFYSFGYGRHFYHGGHHYGLLYYPRYYGYDTYVDTTLRAIVKLDVRLFDGPADGMIDARNYDSGMSKKYPQGGIIGDNGGY